MFDLKPNLLSPEEQLAVDQFSAENERQLEELVVDRMHDPEFVIMALDALLRDRSVTTCGRVADLIMGHGDKVVHIANLRLDCMDWIREQITGAAK